MSGIVYFIQQGDRNKAEVISFEKLVAERQKLDDMRAANVSQVTSEFGRVGGNSSGPAL